MLCNFPKCELYANAICKACPKTKNLLCKDHAWHHSDTENHKFKKLSQEKLKKYLRDWVKSEIKFCICGLTNDAQKIINSVIEALTSATQNLKEMNKNINSISEFRPFQFNCEKVSFLVQKIFLLNEEFTIPYSEIKLLENNLATMKKLKKIKKPQNDSRKQQINSNSEKLQENLSKNLNPRQEKKKKQLNSHQSESLQRFKKPVEYKTEQVKKEFENLNYSNERPVQKFYPYDTAQEYFDRKDNVVTKIELGTKKKRPKSKSGDTNTWACQCGRNNKNFSDRCISCRTMKSKDDGRSWNCMKCKFKNLDENSFICSKCDVVDNDRYLSLGKKVVEPNRNLANADRDSVENKKFPPKDEIRVEMWECSNCRTSNIIDFEICMKCENLKPGVKGWICKSCKFLNNEFDSKCSTCNIAKESNEVLDQEYWICEKCNTAIVEGVDFCEGCEFRQDRYDIQPPNKEINDPNYTICINCNNKTLSSVDKCSSCQYPLTGQKLERFKVNEREAEVKKKLDDDNWKCQKCFKINLQSQKRCRQCTTDRPDTVREDAKIQYQPKDYRNNILDEPEIDQNKSWKCIKCSKVNSSDLTDCIVCTKTKPTVISNKSQEPERNDGSPIKNPNIESKNEWFCIICNTRNLNSAYKCKRCYNKKPKMGKTNFLEQNSKNRICSICKTRIKQIICICKIHILVENEKCPYCWNDTKLIKECSSCTRRAQ